MNLIVLSDLKFIGLKKYANLRASTTGSVEDFDIRQGKYQMLDELMNHFLEQGEWEQAKRNYNASTQPARSSSS
jgi:hypothetical protein